MSDPAPYVPGYSFTNYQTANPSVPLPGPQVDNELANVSSSLNATIDALEDVRRSDGAIQNGVVRKESLATDVLIGFSTPTIWASNTIYAVNDAVFNSNKFYRCITAHTSTSVFDPTKWLLLADLTMGVSDTGVWFSGVDTVKTADYTVLVGDAGKMLIANSATPITFTWTDAFGLGNALFLVRNIGLGALTIRAATGQSIESVANPAGLVLPTGRFSIVWVTGSSLRAQVISAVTQPASTGIGNLVAFGSIDGNTLVDVGIGALGNDNRIVNGAMMIDRRNAGASKSCPAATQTYVVDRFYVNPTGAAVTAQQVAGSGRWAKALKISGAASVTAMKFGQRIESYNINGMAGQTANFSCYIDSAGGLASVTATFYYANAADNFAGGMTQFAQTTFTSLSGLAKNTFQVTLPSQAANGVCIELSTGALGAGVTLTTTGWQFERGNGDFEFLDAAIELTRCQRYFDTVVVGAQSAGIGIMSTPWYTKVRMRASPAAANIIAGSSGNATASGFFVYDATAGTFQINATASGGFVTNSVYTLSAEL